MTQLTTEQFIKIIIGVFVFVVVIVGVFMFFRFHVIDFFKGYTDEEPVGGQTGTETQGGTGEEITPPSQETIKKVTDHCGWCSNPVSLNLWRCVKEECENYLSPEVLTKLNVKNMKCQFVDNKCIAVLI